MIYQNIEFYKIPTIEDYLISECGKVLSLKMKLPKILKIGISSSGYKQVSLCYNSKYRLFRLHRLLAHTFKGLDLFNPREVIDHIDEDRLNNSLDNLDIVTNRENLRRAKEASTKESNIYKNDKGYSVKFQINSKNVSFGTYDLLSDAIIIRDKTQTFINKDDQILRSEESILAFRTSELGLSKTKSRNENISYYETNPIRKGDFKLRIKKYGLDISDFTETYHSTKTEKSGDRRKLFTYKYCNEKLN